MKGVTTINQSFFYTLPVVDGFNWGETENTAGLKLMVSTNGTERPVSGNKVTFRNSGKDNVEISWSSDNGDFTVVLKEKTLMINAKNQLKSNWFLDLNVAKASKTSVTTIGDKNIDYLFDGHKYQMNITKGSFEKPKNGALYRIRPEGQAIVLRMSDE